ncbi:pirin domain-containing protein [Phanerochaete sordida]|uniref:Pirin domain-containing protein n=1 Tax=Phanerochaete sordida TaxID=48140 RepID=A0A9P3GED2_9APHY|nr:pirin domain-containing protein [Phanerochaete sordida]
MSVKFVQRPSTARGHADHDWLKTFHTFSFAMYQDDEHSQFGPLRVINEDRVAAHTGFGAHGHREFEIFSYIVAGELEHGDSMGNREVLKRGDLQMTSTGTGIRHSEKAHGEKQVHFLQIWAIPNRGGLKPQYFTRHFPEEEKRDKWCTVVAPVGAEGVVEKREASGPAPVHSALTMYATILSPAKALSHTLPASEVLPRKAYVHLIQTSGYNPGAPGGATITLKSAGQSLVLREGDGAYIMGDPNATFEVRNDGDRSAELILFDLE